MPTTASSSPNIASVMPALRAEAVWLAMQYSHPLVTLTATYNNSLTKGLNAPSAITSLTLSQVRLSSVGSFARYFQKLLTSSTLRLSLISSNTARTRGVASAYSIGLGRLIDFLLNFSRKGPHGPHPEEPCAARRLEGWPLARPRPWQSFVLREPQDADLRSAPQDEADG